MKKHLFLLVFAIATTAMQAQNGNTFSFSFHDMDEYQFNVENTMRQRNGDFLFVTFFGAFLPPYQFIPLGDIFYKMSPSTFTITDSLFLEDPEAPYYLFSQNPHCEGNIRANFEYHEDCDSTFLRICHFPDDGLSINHDEDILTPVCEGYAYGSACHLVDCWGDLIMQYSKERDFLRYDIYATRFDSDGTLKCHTLLREDVAFDTEEFEVLKESPLQYFQWHGTEDHKHLNVFVIDSLLHNNTIVLNLTLTEDVEYLWDDGLHTKVISVGGDDILVAATYVCDTNPYGTAEYGVAVAKYDLRTMQRKGHIVFNDYPGGYENQVECLGFKMMSDGTVYLLYKEEGYPEESIIVVKMDTDLNVDWKRFCKTDNINITRLKFPILYEDENGEEQGIVWAGIGLNKNNHHYGLLYFFLNHEGPVNAVDGSGMEIRPYTFYPNPAREQLHMQFSPDVQPAQVELYDLQGRLVRTQNKTFESIDLSQLPAGTYTMRVTLVDGKSYTDKVVKE